MAPDRSVTATSARAADRGAKVFGEMPLRGSHASTASFGRSIDEMPPAERVGAALAWVRRGPSSRTSHPLPSAAMGRGRAEKQTCHLGRMNREKIQGHMACTPARQSSHPGKGNVLLHFRYFFCSGICSAVTRSTGPPSCAPRGCHLEAGKEEIL